VETTVEDINIVADKSEKRIKLKFGTNKSTIEVCKIQEKYERRE
jgi:hypothetical protein